MRYLLVLALVSLAYFASGTTPHMRPARILRLLRYIVPLYNQSIINPAVVRLNQLMDPPLLAQAYGIVDSIRGWASTLDEERAHVEIALNFLRRGALYYCLEYVHGLLQRNFILNNRRRMGFEDFLLRERVRIALQNWEWPVPENQIVREELTRIRLFSINVDQRNGEPYFRLSLRTPAPIRFNENILRNPHTEQFPLYSRPRPRAPELNRNNEVDILYRAQRLVLSWYREFVNTRMVEFEPYMNENSFNLMEVILQAAVQQSNEHECVTYTSLMSIALLQRCLRFLRSEFNRYDCHVYHREHRDVGFDAHIRGYHARLSTIARVLTERANNLRISARHNAFYAYVTRRVPFHVGYALNRRGVILLIVFECDVNTLVQDHYNYEE